MHKRGLRKYCIGVICIVAVQFISGCVSKVPGTEWGGTYCIETRYSDAYHKTVEASEFSYGRYKKYSLGSNHGLCSLTEFHVLNVEWETKSGVRRKETIDVAPLIRDMKSKYKIPISYSSPDLLIEIVDRTFMLSYVVDGPEAEKERGNWEVSNQLYINTE